MGHLPEPKRFKFNPVEVAVFALTTLTFGYSLYNLFYFRSDLLSGIMASPNPTRKTEHASLSPESAGQDRSPASTGTGRAVLNLEIPCDKSKDIQTDAGKVRLNGSLCDARVAQAADEELEENEDAAEKAISARQPALSLSKTRVINNTNHYSATVFADAGSRRYSTDYIPLNPGKNLIHVEFTYSGGQAFNQDLAIDRN